MKREESKTKRVRGNKYFNSSKNEVPAKVFYLVTQCCKNKCYEKFSLQTQCNLYDSFYSGQGKYLQDSLLASCMSKSESTKCAREQKKPRLHTWQYCVKDGGMATVECQKCILSLFKISMKRLRVMDGVQNIGWS